MLVTINFYNFNVNSKDYILKSVGHFISTLYSTKEKFSSEFQRNTAMKGRSGVYKQKLLLQGGPIPMSATNY